MPNLSDHERRDAEHIARSLIGVELHRFRRRMEEKAKGAIKEGLEHATQTGEEIDGVELGKAAAADAIAAYIGGRRPEPAIEGTAAPALPPEQ